MVKIDFDERFKKTISKIKDSLIKEKIEKLVIKIRNNPQIGKPMKHNRKGTREVYLTPFRFSYAYNRNRNTIIILDFYHKDKQ